jgi:hypothetical protein
MSAQRMSNADAAWLHMDRPTNLMVVISRVLLSLTDTHPDAGIAPEREGVRDRHDRQRRSDRGDDWRLAPLPARPQQPRR